MSDIANGKLRYVVALKRAARVTTNGRTAIGAGVLISELRKERAARGDLEQETTQLKLEIEKLKSRPIVHYY